VLLLPFVLDKRLLKRLALPRAIADSFRPHLPPRKKEWRRFEEIVKRHRIHSLYHFTDSRNLDSVRSYGGLYSWWQCEQRGIKITAPGSDRLSRRLDRKKKLEDYVRLSFNASQPMMHVASRDGRTSDIKILEISSSVIYLTPTLFSDINATDSQAQVGGDLESFKRIEFSIATGEHWEAQVQKKRFQVEVSVSSYVPLKRLV
jgi:hypothetical protein